MVINATFSMVSLVFAALLIAGVRWAPLQGHPAQKPSSGCSWLPSGGACFHPFTEEGAQKYALP